jgi:hypothetical protein
MKLLLSATVLGIATATLHAQQKPVAFVPTAAATVTGDLSVTGDKASLGGSSVVTALDRTAVVTLARGGTVDVCQSSSLHLTGSSDALLLALDRGSLELHLKAGAGDALMTPDLRFTFPGGGPLDLRVRVIFNGDTCVENRGKKAPTVNIADQFGEASYELKPNQHVLFEHGSLKEVVDREEVPCGCPPLEKGISLADALLKGTPQQRAAAQNPFPTAVSEGLAPPTPLPPETPGVTHTQITASLSYNAGASEPPPQGRAAPTAAPTPVPKGPLHAIAHFFKHIFGGG